MIGYLEIADSEKDNEFFKRTIFEENNITKLGSKNKINYPKL